MYIFYSILGLCIAIGSYGFIDPNLTLSSHSLILGIIKPLFYGVYYQRYITAGAFTGVLIILFVLYIKMLFWEESRFSTIRLFIQWILPFVVILTFSYPMLSYDLFNYMTSAKVAYTHHENPYIVMPIEIPNDPNLSFTRAANKVALYGPTWILLTWIPHTLGMGTIWQTILAFKSMTALLYLCMCYLIWRGTKKMQNVLFFALNPLVLIEVLISGHNDIAMMVLALGGVLLWQTKRVWYRVSGLLMICLSMFVKGVTVVFVPLLFFQKLSRERLMFIVSCLLFLIFIIAAPLREELYPWYAVWFITTISFLPYKQYRWVWTFIIALSMGLELRHIPYMAMGYYEGIGPILRTIFTIVPIVCWVVWYVINLKSQIPMTKKNST